jgi:hypothetical protein
MLLHSILSELLDSILNDNTLLMINTVFSKSIKVFAQIIVRLEILI